MTKQLSSMDMHFLLKELSILIDGKVNKVYAPSKKHIIIEFFVSGKGKYYLKIYSPEYLCISSEKESTEETHISNLLRKYLNNARLRKIVQPNFERIIELVFEAKEEAKKTEYILIAELFSKGNIIFCKDDKTIIYVVESHNWKDRTLRGGIKYELPPAAKNVLEMGKDDFIGAIDNKPEKIVSLLAKGLSLGGKYAEELCLLAGVDKSRTEVGRADCEKIYSALSKLMKKKTKPVVVIENGKNVDFLPFLFTEKKDCKEFATFSEAIDFYFSSQKETKKDLAIGKFEQKLSALEKIRSEQEAKIKQLNEDAEKNKEKGELIYQKYAAVKEVIDELSKARKKYSWKDIKEKLKGNKVIKDINEKESKVVIEL